MSGSLELRLVIRKQGSEFTAVAEQPDGTPICSNSFHYKPSLFSPLTFPPQLPEPEPSSWLARRFTRHVPRTSHETQIKQHGMQLFEYAFGTGRKFREYLRQQRDIRDIHLRLVFTPDSTVLSWLPWEYLNDGKDFLGMERNINIVRQLEDEHPAVPTPTHLPLRILALIADRADQVEINAEDELSSLHEMLDVGITGGKVELDIIPEVTAFTLHRILRHRFYHILYYVGCTRYDQMGKRSYLDFEDAWGETEVCGAIQFVKAVRDNLPHLLVIQHRCTAGVEDRDPYHNFALECLQLGLPAVATIPAVMDADSLRIFMGTFLGELTAGQSCVKAVHASRRKLFDKRNAGWGGVNFYTGTAQLQPILPLVQQAASSQDIIVETRKTPVFVDRKSELQNLRQALKDNVSVVSLWGHAGVGKSTLIDQLLNDTSEEFRGVLRIRCDTLREPVSIISKIANFWRTQSLQDHQQAADLLLDSRQDPFVRAEAAQQHLARYRYLFILENIDVWFDDAAAQTAARNDKVAIPLIRSILLGLLEADSRTTFIFTSACRWADLSELPSNRRRNIPLPFLKPAWAHQYMVGLPGLKTVPSEVRQAIYRQLGGHPLVLKLLSAWCLADHTHHLENLLQDAPAQEMSTMDWISILLRDLIDALDPGEAQVLPVAAILNRPFNARIIPNLSLVSSPYAEAMLHNWCRLELIKDAGATGQYEFHPLIRSYILDRMSEEEIRQLHKQAAMYYGAPFVDEARRQLTTHNVTYQSAERETWLARDIHGILGIWLRQERDSEKYQELLDLAMSWHHHLFYAGDYRAAVQIARAIVPDLHRLGYRDLASELLQSAISAAEGYDRAVGMDDLAKLQAVDGHLARALTVYDEVYKTLLLHGTNLQRAHVLTRSARIQQQMGLWQDAVDKYKQALKMMQQEKEQRGQVVCLYQLAVIHRQQDNLKQALVYSQAAKELYNKLLDDHGLAMAAHEQGHILGDMDHLDGALENFAESMRLYRRSGDVACVADNLYEIGNVLHKLGKTEMAIRALEEAEGLYKLLAAPEHATVLRLLEELHEKQQRLTDAVQRFRAAKRKSPKK